MFFTLMFCLIICHLQGSWIVKQSVGKKACLLGKALEAHYFRGKNYLEVDFQILKNEELWFANDYWTVLSYSNTQICSYFQVLIDVGSSTVARGVGNLVFGYINNVVAEMAFVIQVKDFSSYAYASRSLIHAKLTIILSVFSLEFRKRGLSLPCNLLLFGSNLVDGLIMIPKLLLVQGNTQEELPEILLGTCRLNHCDLSKALLALPWTKGGKKMEFFPVSLWRKGWVKIPDHHV